MHQQEKNYHIHMLLGFFTFDTNYYKKNLVSNAYMYSYPNPSNKINRVFN